MNQEDRIILCDHCIDAILSHGERVWVGPEVDYDEFFEVTGKEARCEWCGDEGKTLYDCHF